MNVNFGGLVREDAYFCGSYSYIIDVRIAFVVQWIGEGETSSVAIKYEIILDVPWKIKCEIRFMAFKIQRKLEFIQLDISKGLPASVAFIA